MAVVAAASVAAAAAAAVAVVLRLHARVEKQIPTEERNEGVCPRRRRQLRRSRTRETKITVDREDTGGSPKRQDKKKHLNLQNALRARLSWRTKGLLIGSLGESYPNKVVPVKVAVEGKRRRENSQRN